MVRKLVFINVLGKSYDSDFTYEFYFSDDAEMFWGVDFDVKPASLCNIGVPDKMTYDEIKILKTDIPLNVAQKNSCFSYLDCKDGIIAVAWENLDNAEEYPDEGRLIFPFGMELDEVEYKLSKRNLCFEFK